MIRRLIFCTHCEQEKPYDHIDDNRVDVIRDKRAAQASDNYEGEDAYREQRCSRANVHTSERGDGRATSQEQNGRHQQRGDECIKLNITRNVRNTSVILQA